MKYFITSFFVVILFCMTTFTVSAQNKKISGKVLDVCGNPVAYASIRFQHSDKGWTISDTDGSYETTISNDHDTIICSRIGYIKKFEAIAGNTSINFIMAKEPVKLYTSSVTGTHKYSAGEKLKPVIPESGNSVKIFIEVSADFPGGDKGFTDYLKKSIVYPDSATISDVTGVVKMGFTIDRDGHPKNIKLITGINKFADNAVINAVEHSPKWSPAIQNGRIVEMDKEVSVTFNITGVD